MPEYSDIYVISKKRDRTTVEDFLNHFLPEREERADEYEIPQYSESPELVFKQTSELVDYCCSKLHSEHAIYWRAINDKKPEHAMVFYLSDGCVIYGLSTDANDCKFSTNLLSQLKVHLGSDLGYIGHEASPDVENLNEFLQQIENHRP